MPTNFTPDRLAEPGTDDRSGIVKTLMVSATELDHVENAQVEHLRELLEQGQLDRAIAIGRELSAELTDPSDLATVHVLVGRAEMFNGRMAPAMQRFRLADVGMLAPGDRLRLGMAEALSRYASSGIDEVIHVIDELEAGADGDPLLLAATAGLRAWTYLERNNPTKGVELATLANKRALEHNDADLTVLSWLILGLAHATAAQIDQAATAVATGITFAATSKHGAAAPILHMVAADVDHCRGRIDHAQYHARLSVASSEPISAGIIGVWGHGVLATLADRTGDTPAAANHILNAERALMRGAPMGWGHLALARLRVDRHINAEQSAQRLLDVWRYMNAQGSKGHPTMFSLSTAELISRMTDQTLIKELSGLLNDLEPPNPMDHLTRDLAAAVVAGDVATAVSLVEALERGRATYLTVVGDSMALVADLMVRQSDRRARTFADVAREIYEEIGAHGDQQRLIKRHPSLSQETDLVLSPAERRVVSLVVEGLSNADIAEQLFLSVKTVETHLARVYRRFGVKSRTQLVSSIRDL
jgi:ATP/maltotriose-dependent transcriptional regulator MalT